ncbi:MAG: cyanophycin synthetase [Segetibacter sp.]|nr:cyanophycin synthetase [Segetibacter sp.]
MNIVDIKLLNGPNYWSIQRHKIVVMLLDLEELENYPTNQIPGFYQGLINLIPSLETHLCLEGVSGGFLNRVKEGTWMGHVVEHIALELQSLAGMDTTFGRTAETDKRGQYHIAFSYEEPRAGKYAAQAAVRIAQALVKNEAYDINIDIEALKKIAYDEFPGPSTYSIIKEAENRNIPCVKLNDHGIVQLGFGAKQKRIQATIASTTGCIAVELAGDKEATKKILESADVPVPKGEIIYDEAELIEAIEYVGYPVAIKPVDGNQGKGATTDITTIDDAIEAMKAAKKYSKRVICESSIRGFDFRALVINYKFVAAAMRTPASVTGDGIHTIRQLIDIENRNPKRGNGHQNVLTAIVVDEATMNVLDKKGYTLDTVLSTGEECWLKPTANLSTGGTATDVTDIVHPSNIALFERIARVIGLDICGIDIIATNLSLPIKETGGAVLEVNAAPGFRMHIDPTNGKPRNVAAPVLDMLFPHDNQGTIPIVAVTGTNGKTTTTRLIAHMAKKVGHKVGYTTTDGIYIKDELVVKGDCSGPASAQFVLKDSAVEFAVLECARGGILRAGLGFPFCHAAVITNVAEDHLGLNGIDTIEKLARVKAVVAETVLPTGYAILNADDDLVYAMKDNVRSKVALFSMYENSLRVKRHCQQGGLAAIYSHNYIVILQGSKRIRIEKVGNIPVTFGGKAQFNIANVLGATLAAFVSNFNLDDIRSGLQSFIPSPEATPGRMNMFYFNQFTVMVDYAHNPHGINAIGKYVKTVDASVKIGIIAGVGDRRDIDLMNVGEEAAKVFDEIIIKLDEDLRGRTQDEIFGLVTAGIQRYALDKKITLHTSECAAVETAINNATPGAFITILTDNIAKVLQCVKDLQQKEELEMKEKETMATQ